MRKAERQVHRVASGSSAVTHANQRQLLRETFRHALDHVGHQRAAGARHCTTMLIAIGGNKRDLIFFALHLDRAAEIMKQRTERPFDINSTTDQCDFNFRWNIYGVFSNT